MVITITQRLVPPDDEKLASRVMRSSMIPTCPCEIPGCTKDSAYVEFVAAFDRYMVLCADHVHPVLASNARMSE